ISAICGVDPQEAAGWRGEEPVATAVGAINPAGIGGVAMQPARQPSVTPFGGAPAELVEPIVGSEPLKQAFTTEIGSFLYNGNQRTLVSDPSQAIIYFAQLRGALDPAVHPALAMLENYCEQRRQFDRQLRWHRWLHGWLLVHLPLSIVLMILMFVHIYAALKYR
ncbi:MAG TPA: hypothetical protein VGI75_08740, partial [Pirellulales bacterium]